MSQGEFAEFVDGVVADAQVCAGLAVGVGFGSGLVGVFGGGVAWVGAVGSLGVVDGGEGVEQGLQFGQGGRSWSGGEPAFEGLVEAFDFALGLWVVGVAVFLGDAQGGQEAFEVVVAVGES